jgi:hypothetical protein
MISYHFTSTFLCGCFLISLGIWLFILGIRFPDQLVQNMMLGLAYIGAGSIFVLEGWRFNLLMQLAVLILTASSLYWVIHTHSSSS